jgi:hypothetical protein
MALDALLRTAEFVGRVLFAYTEPRGRQEQRGEERRKGS